MTATVLQYQLKSARERIQLDVGDSANWRKDHNNYNKLL